MPLTKKHPVTGKYIWQEEKEWEATIRFIIAKKTQTTQDLLRNMLPQEVLKIAASKNPHFDKILKDFQIKV